jgi:antitoxin component YwqK of YwqJK toxin-antitoxin module
MIKAEFYEDKLHGKQTVFIEGVKRREAEYVHGRLKDKHYWWDKEGNRKVLASLVGDQLTGWHPNGEKAIEYGWKKSGEREGRLTQWHFNGKKRKQGVIKANRPDGNWTWWHKDGTKNIEGSYINGRATGLFVWWHPNGKKAAEGRVLSDAKGTREYPTGQWRFWYENGQRQIQGAFKWLEDRERAVPSGQWDFWYPSGKRSATVECRDGEFELYAGKCWAEDSTVISCEDVDLPFREFVRFGRGIEDLEVPDFEGMPIVDVDDLDEVFNSLF